MLVSKPSICGFGLNWQHCARMAFVGVTDSFEAYYQAVRRCWRFGQSRPADVHVLPASKRAPSSRNLKRKGTRRQSHGGCHGKRNDRRGQRNILGRAKEFNLYEPQRRISFPHFWRLHK